MLGRHQLVKLILASGRGVLLTKIRWLSAALTLTFAMLESMCIRMGWPSCRKICLRSMLLVLQASTNVYGTKYRSGRSGLFQHRRRRSSSGVPRWTRTNPARGTLVSTRPPLAYKTRQPLDNDSKTRSRVHSPLWSHISPHGCCEGCLSE